MEEVTVRFVNGQRRDLDRLPAWGETLVRNLERRVQELEAHVERLSGDAENARVVVQHFDHPDQAVNNGEVPVTFKFDTSRRFPSYVQAAIREDHAGIPHLNLNGSEAYSIHPRAGNSIDIYLSR